MPGVDALIDKRLFQDRAYNISRTKVEQVRRVIKEITASTMSSLDWNNGFGVLDPFSQVTPVIMLAGDITQGDAIEIATPAVAAIVRIWAFDYPSRNGLVSLEDLPHEFGPAERETIRKLDLLLPMESRLDEFRYELKRALGATDHVEVSFVPQRQGHWVGG